LNIANIHVNGFEKSANVNIFKCEENISLRKNNPRYNVLAEHGFLSLKQRLKFFLKLYPFLV